MPHVEDIEIAGILMVISNLKHFNFLKVIVESDRFTVVQRVNASKCPPA